MAKYRKKPIEIEAIQLASRYSDFTAAPSWFRDALIEIDPLDGSTKLQPGQMAWVGSEMEVRTLEGTIYAKPGDWIVCGIKGELYPCKPDIFAATYDPA